MGFKDFCNKENVNENNSFKGEEIDKKQIEEMYNNFKDKSEDELIFELLKNVDMQKKQGSFNYDLILSQIEKIKPFLSEEQKVKLEMVLGKIK